jgi:hypothetical protein
MMGYTREKKKEKEKKKKEKEKKGDHLYWQRRYILRLPTW